MDIKKILKPIDVFFKKHWRKWTLLAILAIFAYAGFIFYQYIYKPIYRAKEVPSYKLEIKRIIYQDILEIFSQKKETINKIINKDYSNPF